MEIRYSDAGTPAVGEAAAYEAVNVDNVRGTLIGKHQVEKIRGQRYERESMDRDFSGIAVCLRFMALRGRGAKT
jgi:hypothetical protein